MHRSSLLLALVLAFGCEGILLDPVAGPRGPIDPGTEPGVDAGLEPGVEPGPATCEAELPGPRILRLLTRAEYAATVADLLGVAMPDVEGFPIETTVRGYDGIASAQIVTGRHADAYATTAQQLAASIDPGALAARVGASCALSDPACARRFVEGFGLRAFRRPLEPDELERHVALFAPDITAGDPAIGARLVVEAMLASPSFLYRSEVGVAAGDGTFALTSHEVATALSYLFWGTTPDDALLDAAARDALREPADIEAEARRMLEDDRSHDAVASFASQWLGTTRLLGTNRDQALFPEFTPAVRESLREEERRFVLGVVFDGTGRFDELLLADWRVVDGNLRAFYGLGGTGDASFERIGAPPERPGGVLTLGSVMASHAHSNESSPIRRGLFVRDRMLCHDLPPPPADADTTPPGLDPTLTTRERFRRHTENAGCLGCHQFIDGVGFPFEGFDAVGRFRATEHGLPIDTSGELIGLARLDDGTRAPLSGPGDLARALAESGRARDCLATQWWRFARGVIEGGADACSVSALRSRFEASGGDVRDLLVAVVTQRSFLQRRETEVAR